MKLVNCIIVIITKCIILILNILGKKAGTLPGRIALKLNNKFFKCLFNSYKGIIRI